MSESAEPVRYHSLDALRAFALLLGVVFHAAESFMEGHWVWAITDSSPSIALNLFRHAVHSFRLEIFFLLAGFFGRLVYLRRGPAGFARNRLGRILVPLAIGWAVLFPLLVFLWLEGSAKSGRWDFIGIPPEYRHLAPWQLTVAFFANLQFLRKFDLTHLWFLYQLLVLYALALLARATFTKVLDRDGSWSARLDGRLRRLLSTQWSAALLAIPTVPLLLLMRSWDVDTPKESLIPAPAPTLLYGLFFLLGWWLHRQPQLLESVARFWKGNLILGLCLVLPSRFGAEALFRLGLGEQHVLWIRPAHSVLYALMMWTFALGFTGLFVRRFDGESRGWRYVADASYWIYLVHLPLVVALQIWMARWPVHWTLKFPLINLIAFPILFLSYHYLVRSTFIGVQLNGKRHPLVPIFRRR